MTHRVDIHQLETASPGTIREIKSHHFGVEGARPKIYLQAAIHADELPALLVAHHLLRKLIEADARGEILGEVILVPVANPIGLSQTLNGYLVGRYELSGELNFNRNWPDLSSALAEKVAGKLGSDSAANEKVVRAALPSIVDEFNQQGEF
ncbi:MAG: succinylglutamate desuccinylase/aspartoacylase family protein, partial [Pseudomonadota bacterium]